MIPLPSRRVLPTAVADREGSTIDVYHMLFYLTRTKLYLLILPVVVLHVNVKLGGKQNDFIFVKYKSIF